LPESKDEENIMESQAIGIAPRILMPKNTFIEAAEHLGISYGKDNRIAISTLADFYGVSKQSVEIRLEECSLL
jgi:Zn-dependent peptidase ImmA (M78 family)